MKFLIGLIIGFALGLVSAAASTGQVLAKLEEAGLLTADRRKEAAAWDVEEFRQRLKDAGLSIRTVDAILGRTGMRDASSTIE